jgi:hypothetical protein
MAGAGVGGVSAGAVGTGAAGTAGAGGFFLKKLNMGWCRVAGVETGLEAAAIIAG